MLPGREKSEAYVDEKQPSDRSPAARGQSFSFRAPWTNAVSAQSAGRVSGELKKWHRVTITFDGPQSSETADPNPFRDYRLTVVFRSGDTEVAVPGFYAADGNAAEPGADSGNKWRVHFAPPAEGTWPYTASFRTGRRVATSDDSLAGGPTAFDGASGSFEVGPADKAGRDLRGKGMLRYVGGHYLRFAETSDYFLKGGADSPENFLAYRDFDGTVEPSDVGRETQGEARRARLHAYEPHCGTSATATPRGAAVATGASSAR